jgi:hypothetical protein
VRAFRAYYLRMNRGASLLLLLFVVPLTAANVRLAKRRIACGVSFRAPRGWIVKTYQDGDDIPCAVGMKPPTWNGDPTDDIDRGDYAITLQITADDFEDAAARAGFLRVKTLRAQLAPGDETPPWPPLAYRDDDWVTMGRMAILNSALPIRSLAWTGLMGERTRGYSHRTGGNAGMGNVVMAFVVSRTKPFVAVVITGGPLDGVVRAVVPTIQIRRKP